MLKIISVYSLIFSLMFVTPAMAYIDPGSGSAIISAVIGGIVAIVISIKTYWYRIKSLFLKKRNEESKVDLDNKE